MGYRGGLQSGGSEAGARQLGEGLDFGTALTRMSTVGWAGLTLVGSDGLRSLRALLAYVKRVCDAGTPGCIMSQHYTN